uniref:(northern house mosquito) hypothetical protein n=1 Tax=Culex pipiens TaxID=7175 RepID=A0A8D8AWD7_CULPI
MRIPTRRAIPRCAPPGTSCPPSRRKSNGTARSASTPKTTWKIAAKRVSRWRINFRSASAATRSGNFCRCFVAFTSWRPIRYHCRRSVWHGKRSSDGVICSCYAPNGRGDCARTLSALSGE